ncbi:molybdenum cofactor synthesis domain-containing protein [Halarsenatibacter silvermanii]|uniref:Molybdopterin molybdenumtransferase n=2 Tax=Halarsenatibacter silvermanii TaxID=321763 RepID=A0A1G9I7L4_9FIRM|nr:molybdenum cofactor synthesis domain-containing protein [Halarsenatibacter silvermanii]
MMKRLKVEEAVGHVLAHDITEIKKGERKGPAFKKGYIIKEKDVPHLLDLGKKSVYILENSEDRVHENEGAARLADLAQGSGLKRTEPSEGKINLLAAHDGLLKVESSRLKQLNLHPDVMMATRHNNTPVEKGEKLAGTRIIPLLIADEKLREVENELGDKPLMRVKHYEDMKAAVITTGSEVYEGRVEDQFTEVLEEKLEYIGGDVVLTDIKPDDRQQIAEAISSALAAEVDLVVCTGGMSVDPDDVTRFAIEDETDELISYGAPVLPGAMFMLAYADNVPVIGLPACAMFYDVTVLDIMLPRIAAGEKIRAEEIAEAGHGGLCLQCEICRYPECSFGRS